MDELQMIATMLDEPLTQESDDAMRHRVLNGMRGPQQPERRGWRRPALWSGFGLAATAAAVTGAVVLSSGTTPRAPDHGPVPVAVEPMSAKTVLLTAAEHAEHAASAPATGKYWHVKRIQSGAVYNELHDYWMLSQQLIEQWIRPDGRSWTGYRSLGGVPMTAKDAPAFKRDGSPDPNPITPKLETEPGTTRFPVCDGEMTFRQIQALPTVPAKLETVLERAVPRKHPTQGRTAREVVRNCVADLLSSVPAPPKVRAAAYRMFAGMPGVTAVGKVTDERGRKGVALRVKNEQGSVETVVIDPASSLVLSTSSTTPHVPGVNDKFLYLAAGWTDEGPKVPAKP